MKTEYRYAKPEHKEIVESCINTLRDLVAIMLKDGMKWEEIIETPEYRSALHVAVDARLLYEIPVYILEDGESCGVEA